MQSQMPTRVGVISLVVLMVGIGPAPILAAPGYEGVPTLGPGHGPYISILCYQDISEDADAPTSSVSASTLRRQIRYLRDQGFEFATVSQLASYRSRHYMLPSKVAVLTFDGGYESFYDDVLPILREEDVGATLSIITSLVDSSPADGPARLSWEQIREIAASGFVEIASQTHALHTLNPEYPEGENMSAVTTRLYDTEMDRYEDNAAYRVRLRDDFGRSRELLTEHAGVEVRVLSWPFGEHNQVAREIARLEGLPVTLGLEGGWVTRHQLRQGYLPRNLVTRETPIEAQGMTWFSPSLEPVQTAGAVTSDL